MQIFLISSIIQTSSLFFIQIFISSIFLMFCIIIFFNSYLPHQFHFLQHHVLGKFSSAPFFFPDNIIFFSNLSHRFNSFFPSHHYFLQFKSSTSFPFFFHTVSFFSNLPHTFHFSSMQIFFINSIFLFNPTNDIQVLVRLYFLPASSYIHNEHHHCRKQPSQSLLLVKGFMFSDATSDKVDLLSNLTPLPNGARLSYSAFYVCKFPTPK